MLDEVRVGDGDDEDGHGGHQDQEDGEVCVLAKRAERRLGAVGGRRESIRSQAYPCQESHKGDMVEDLRVREIAWLADDRAIQPSSPAGARLRAHTLTR